MGMYYQLGHNYGLKFRVGCYQEVNSITYVCYNLCTGLYFGDTCLSSGFGFFFLLSLWPKYVQMFTLVTEI